MRVRQVAEDLAPALMAAGRQTNAGDPAAIVEIIERIQVPMLPDSPVLLEDFLTAGILVHAGLDESGGRP